MTNNQRQGASSNPAVGLDFERLAMDCLIAEGIKVERGLSLPLGIGQKKKDHEFDLGCEHNKIIVECKSHTWRKPNNVPSAKLSVWNEAMYYFHMAPAEYRKIMLVKRDWNESKGMTLLNYYLNRYRHMVPEGVEFAELCERNGVIEWYK